VAEPELLGESISTWHELRRYKDGELSADQLSLIKENMHLRAKVSFYEDRLRQLINYRDAGK
jgi:hypothetical protein